MESVVAQVNLNVSNDWATVFISICNEYLLHYSNQKQNSFHLQVPQINVYRIKLYSQFIVRNSDAEWLELRNTETRCQDLFGWDLRHTVPRPRSRQNIVMSRDRHVDTKM